MAERASPGGKRGYSTADNLTENLKRIERKSTTPIEFEYYDKGSMATVGRNLAVVDLPKPKMHFHGLFAWFIWMGLHLFLILGVKNRIIVFINWIYSYLTYDQSLRLIFKEFYRPRKPVDAQKQQQVNPTSAGQAV
jgi:NADH dehydrogenase